MAKPIASRSTAPSISTLAPSCSIPRVRPLEHVGRAVVGHQLPVSAFQIAAANRPVKLAHARKYTSPPDAGLDGGSRKVRFARMRGQVTEVDDGEGEARQLVGGGGGGLFAHLGGGGGPDAAPPDVPVPAPAPPPTAGALAPPLAATISAVQRAGRRRPGASSTDAAPAEPAGDRRRRDRRAAGRRSPAVRDYATASSLNARAARTPRS